MITAVVYVSNTGYTRQYAQLFALGQRLPLYTLQQARKELGEKDSVLFMGWVCANKISGYMQAQKQFAVQAVCAVGLSAPQPAYTAQLRHKNQVGKTPLFYLQGGFDIDRLRGPYRFLMRRMSKTLAQQLSKKNPRTPEDDCTLELLTRGGSCVDVQNLQPLLAWYEQYQREHLPV